MPRTKKTIAVAAVGAAALLGGGITVANAASGGGADNEASITGTVKAPAETTPEGADTPASEQAQTDQLASLATVTADQAKAAAERAVGGKATAVELGDEDGFVVYDVTVAGPKGPVDVTVNAGSGAVLAQEVDNEGGTEATEGNDGSGINDTSDANDGPETADANQGSTDTDTGAPQAPAPATAG